MARGAQIEIIRTGSRGMIFLEPLVEVETAAGRVGYGPVKASDVASLFDAGFLSGGAHALGIGKTDEHPFFVRQNRLTFARCGIIDPVSLEDYAAFGGWRGLKRAIEIGPAATIAEVTKSGLRGRGGAGFPTGIKWKTVADAPADRRYIVCNADEGDSGTFADRMIMEGDPFALIEGHGHRRDRRRRRQGLCLSAFGVSARGANLPAGARNRARAQGILAATFLAPGMASTSSCASAPALMSAARRPRSSKASKASAGLFGPNRRCRPIRACSSGRRSSTMFFRWSPCRRSSTAAANLYAGFGMGRSRGTMPLQIAGNVRFGGLFETAFGLTLGEIVEEIGGGTAIGPPGARRAVRRTARRLFPGRLFRYAL